MTTGTEHTLRLIEEYLTQGGDAPGIDAETLDREARLVAAAPTLLKACLDALLVEQHFGNERSELANRLRFAIFEAQGNLII